MQLANLPELFQPLPYPREIRQWDSVAVELGISENVLMENAAQEAFAVLKKYQPALRNKNIWFFMGNGNNGGDAACMARYAQNACARPFILHRKPLKQYKGVTAKQIRIAQKLKIPFYHMHHAHLHNIPIPPADIIVDGLLGTGFQGELKTDLQALISAINETYQKAFVLALDIPSGLDGQTGRPSPVAVRADATATFAAYKPGLILPGAKKWTGNLHLCPIGFPRALHDQVPCSSYMLAGECLGNIGTFPEQSYKNLFGHVCVVGGAKGLEGAAHLAARSALRTGAGLVSVMTAESSMPLVKNNWPEIMCWPIQVPLDTSWPDSLSTELEEKLQGFSTLVIGPGMGRSDNACSFLKAILQIQNRPPVVLDADALTLIGRHPDLLSGIQDADILTPHPGEAATLLGISNQDIQQDRFGALQQLCAIQPGVVILKGACTLVGQQKAPHLVSPYDIPQLAIGGSGDVLAGCLGALRAQGNMAKASYFVAAQGVMLHALAGKVCSQRFAGRGNCASEIADAIPKVLADRFAHCHVGKGHV